MGLAPLLLVLMTADPTAAEVSTLKGEQHSGRLVRLDPTEAVLRVGERELRVPVRELLDVRFVSPEKATTPEHPIAVRLADDSQLIATQVTSDRGEATLTHPQLGTLRVPTKALQSIRLASGDGGLEGKWNQLFGRDSRKDLLVIRKGDVLDHLDGVIGTITPETVSFLIEEDEVPVKREKVFGLIYYRRDAQSIRPAARVEFGDGESLQARSVMFDGREWKATLLSGGEVTLPAGSLRLVDFSLGKLRYLSAMEPREVRQVPYFDIVWKYREDGYLFGGPIRLGHKTYARGLSLSSGTTLKYRLGGDYRRLQAVMGIDDRARSANGDLDVTIRGDGRKLFESHVKGGDPPRDLDLDVSGVVEVEIEIGFGGNLAIGDFLDLAEAKVIK